MFCTWYWHDAHLAVEIKLACMSVCLSEIPVGLRGYCFIVGAHTSLIHLLPVKGLEYIEEDS